MSESNVPNFQGKILFVHLQGAAAGVSQVIESCRCEEQAGRYFLVGRVPAIEGVDLRPQGKIMAIAWDRIEHYEVFDTKEEVQAFFRAPTRVMPVLRQRKPNVFDRLFGRTGA